MPERDGSGPPIAPPDPALLSKHALPRWRHIPGSGTEADFATLEPVKALCPALTEPSAWQDNQAYRYGWRLFCHGFYWEAHELWEAVWLASRPNSREKLMLKAVIQLANARLKADMGKAQASQRIAGKIHRLVEELGDEDAMGVPPEWLRAQIRAMVEG